MRRRTLLMIALVGLMAITLLPWTILAQKPPDQKKSSQTKTKTPSAQSKAKTLSSSYRQTGLVLANDNGNQGPIQEVTGKGVIPSA